MPSLDLLAEVADSGSPAYEKGWSAQPIRPPNDHNNSQPSGNEGARFTPTVLSVTADRDTKLPKSLAVSMSLAWGLVRQREHATRRSKRLQAILDATTKWNETADIDDLLSEMAEAATRLLDAERATIFLWDRKNKELIGLSLIHISSPRDQRGSRMPSSA